MPSPPTTRPGSSPSRERGNHRQPGDSEKKEFGRPEARHQGAGDRNRQEKGQSPQHSADRRGAEARAERLAGAAHLGERIAVDDRREVGGGGRYPEGYIGDSARGVDHRMQGKEEDRRFIGRQEGGKRQTQNDADTPAEARHEAIDETERRPAAERQQRS
jgi:hypothetical protein